MGEKQLNDEEIVPRIEEIGGDGLLFINRRGVSKIIASNLEDVEDLHFLHVEIPTASVVLRGVVFNNSEIGKPIEDYGQIARDE